MHLDPRVPLRALTVDTSLLLLLLILLPRCRHPHRQASVQWEFCRCDGEWGDSGCVEPGASHLKAATECFTLDPASLASMRPEDVMAAVASEGRLPLQVLRYDIQGAEPSAIVFGRERRFKCTTPRRRS